MNDPILTPEEQKLSLEDRREARKEHALRWLMEHPGAATTFRKGIAQFDKAWGGTKVRSWDQSMTTPGETMGERLRQDLPPQSATFAVPPVVKRTLEERVQSMVQRLKQADPAVQDGLIRRIAAEYWKAGAPVTEEALRAVAAHYLNAVSGPIQVGRR